MGISRLLLTAEASSSPTRRGIDCSLLGLLRRVSWPKFVCATESSSSSSESRSNSIKIAGTSSQWLADIDEQRQTCNPKTNTNHGADIPASRLSVVDRSGGAI